MRSRRKQKNCLPALALALAALAIPARGVAAPRPARRRKHKSGWWTRVARVRATQPHWITPVDVVTPLLEEEFRFDQVRQVAPNGATTDVSFDSKGLELIPTRHIEVIAGVPAYFHRSGPAPTPSGWGDFPVLVKYRMLSAPAREGNYVLSAFFGATFPTETGGSAPDKVVFHPALAFGKGWGAFDAQGTFGAAIPAGTWRELGTPLALNTAFQYHVFKKFWPELEVNSTSWPNGALQGNTETFLTPGVVVGRFPFWGRAGLVVGAGMQIAVTHFHRTNHNLIFTIRFPF